MLVIDEKATAILWLSPAACTVLPLAAVLPADEAAELSAPPQPARQVMDMAAASAMLAIRFSFIVILSFFKLRFTQCKTDFQSRAGSTSGRPLLISTSRRNSTPRTPCRMVELTPTISRPLFSTVTVSAPTTAA